jgi:hypothetical protein
VSRIAPCLRINVASAAPSHRVKDRRGLSQAFRHILFGEGETGLMVYTVLQRYWQWTPEEDVRPLIFLMSD